MRILIFKYAITLFLVILLGGLFYTQIVQGEYYADLSENNRVRLQVVPAPRGKNCGPRRYYSRGEPPFLQRNSCSQRYFPCPFLYSSRDTLPI